MKITFLGTGTSHGVPLLACQCPVCRSKDKHDKRMRSSLLIEHNNGKNWVIDTGPDFRTQMLRTSVRSLDAALMTHEHKDHTSGLDDLRAFNYAGEKAIDIYGQARVLDNIRQCYEYIFSPVKYPGVPNLELHEIVHGNSFLLDGITVLPLELIHYKLPVTGFRIGGLTYITDANNLSDETKSLAAGSKVLVLNALRKESHISHFNLEEALAMADELEAQTCYFTHISHQMGFHREVSRSLPPNRFLAFDGLALEI